ncbi:MAG TPA: hypothetical protein PKL77_07260 [Candidatus Omnitrophota bacterium]|nr:hypothetical protein [Candidatus Omnitrophota bacterium]
MAYSINSISIANQMYQYFYLGLIAGVGIIGLLASVVIWFLARKIDKYDRNCDATNDLKTEIGELKAVCDERNKKGK